MKSYENQEIWRKLQNYLPEHNKITEECNPVEEKWKWKDNKIHLDQYTNHSAEKKIILLHGVGGNSRVLSFIGVPLYKHGFEVIAPDLLNSVEFIEHL